MWCGDGVFLGVEKHATDFNFIFGSCLFRDTGCAWWAPAQALRYSFRQRTGRRKIKTDADPYGMTTKEQEQAKTTVMATVKRRNAGEFWMDRVALSKLRCGWARGWYLSYSVLRASIGSIMAARRQGREVAMTVAMAKMQMTGTMTDGSVGEVS
jgi:hypothetical protein